MATQITGSYFSWMDYSERERREALDVIDLFSEQDTRDELGIGTVRDAFADLLFPGTTTIQTRARYFLFVPWIYTGLERLKVPSHQMAVGARREEITLIDALASSDDPDGTIGIEARASLKRLPSNVYWLGLRRWGIRLFPGSQDQYNRSLDAFYASDSRFSRSRRNDEGEPVDGSSSRSWHAAVPARPDGFPRQASFSLTEAEADYLHERLLTHAPRTLLTLLVDRGEPSGRVDLPWQHQLALQAPPAIRDQVDHARAFSEMMHGAALLYNLMLAQHASNELLVERYRTALQEWSLVIAEREEALVQWDRQRFWQIVGSGGNRIPIPTRGFVDAWLDLVLEGSGPKQAASVILTNERAQQLIFDRERSIKRDRARLDNRRALELWSGAAGTAQLSYRWPVAQTIISDIVAALRGKTADA